MLSIVLVKTSFTSSISNIHVHTFKITARSFVFASNARSSYSFFSKGMGSKGSLLSRLIALVQGEGGSPLLGGNFWLEKHLEPC